MTVVDSISGSNSNHWQKSLAVQVDEIVQDPAMMTRFQEMVRVWQGEEEARGPGCNGVVLLPTRAMTLPEKYAALAAIHDRVCAQNGAEPINPWKTVTGKSLRSLNEEDKAQCLNSISFHVLCKRFDEIQESDHERLESVLLDVRSDSDKLGTTILEVDKPPLNSTKVTQMILTRAELERLREAIQLLLFWGSHPPRDRSESLEKGEAWKTIDELTREPIPVPGHDAEVWTHKLREHAWNVAASAVHPPDQRPYEDFQALEQCQDTLHIIVAADESRPTALAAADCATTKPVHDLRGRLGTIKGIVAVIFTDVIDSTKLNNELGDADFKQISETHFTRVREVLREQDGVEAGVSGDSLLVLFRTAAAAFTFALAVQRDTGHDRIKIRVGIHVGEVEYEQSLNGLKQTATLNLAHRIMKKSDGESVWCSGRAYDDIRQAGQSYHKDHRWTPHKAVKLKGFENAPQDLYSTGSKVD